MPGVTANAGLDTAGRPAAPATSVYPVPVLSRLKVANVAMPALAATAVVPASAPPLGFVPMVTRTVSLNALATLPRASRAVTLTAGVMADPAVTSVGGTVNARCVGAPAVMSNAALVAMLPGRLVADAVSV